MFEDLIDESDEPVYERKGLNENEFKILFCSICNLYKDCKTDIIKKCIKEYQEGE